MSLLSVTCHFFYKKKDEWCFKAFGSTVLTAANISSLKNKSLIVIDKEWLPSFLFFKLTIKSRSIMNDCVGVELNNIYSVVHRFAIFTLKYSHCTLRFFSAWCTLCDRCTASENVYYILYMISPERDIHMLLFSLHTITLLRPAEYPVWWTE